MNASRLEWNALRLIQLRTELQSLAHGCSRILLCSEQSGTPVLGPAAISIVTSEPAIEPEDTEPKTWAMAWGIGESVGCFKRCAYARAYQQRAQRK